MGRPISTTELDAARSTLDWWLTAGVDTLIEETPRDWLIKPFSPTLTSSQRMLGSQGLTVPQLQTPEMPATAGVTVSSSGALPGDLEALRHLYETQSDLPFAGSGTTRVLPTGNPASGLMMLADMPTGDDAAAGVIFSGDAGLLFDRMLAAIGRDRASIYLATLSCLAAPGGRLDAATADDCGALARHHLRLAGPTRVLLLGEAATRVMTGLSLPAARGRVHAIDLGGDAGEQRVNAVATYHPRYLLTRPAAKAGAWSDLQLLMGIDATNGRTR